MLDVLSCVRCRLALKTREEDRQKVARGVWEAQEEVCVVHSSGSNRCSGWQMAARGVRKVQGRCLMELVVFYTVVSVITLGYLN